MNTNLDVDLITELNIHTHTGFSILIHCLKCKYYSFLNSNSPHSPPENLPGYTVEGFFLVN